MTTFVSVGNTRQPFFRLLKEIEKMACSLPQPVVIQHGHTPFSSDLCDCFEFLEMAEYQNIIKESELIIMQAGVGGVLTAVEAGKVPIVVPRMSLYGEHIDDHQSEFGREVSRSGRVVLVENISELSVAASRALSKQHDQPDISVESPIVNLVRKVIDQVAAKEQ